jgi:hypothetical protein
MTDKEHAFYLSFALNNLLDSLANMDEAPAAGHPAGLHRTEGRPRGVSGQLQPRA